MKTINNTCVEVLPSLLDKSKKSTIRKAWKEFWIGEKGGKPWTEPKPAKFEVGEVVEMVWDEESEYETFCPCHGIGFDTTGKLDVQVQHDGMKGILFNKNLGKVRITKIYKIILGMELVGDCFNAEVRQGYIESEQEIDEEKLALREGFKSFENMMKYFDDNYDLSTPKEFWVYEWSWLE